MLDVLGNPVFLLRGAVLGSVPYGGCQLSRVAPLANYQGWLLFNVFMAIGSWVRSSFIFIAPFTHGGGSSRGPSPFLTAYSLGLGGSRDGARYSSFPFFRPTWRSVLGSEPSSTSWVSALYFCLFCVIFFAAATTVLGSASLIFILVFCFCNTYLLGQRPQQ